MNTHLKAGALQPLLSPYILAGRNQDRWRIDHADIEGDRLQAQVSMTSTFASPTDPGGFHLSAFTALEIASQLIIVYMHVGAGLTHKTREVWMAESSMRAVRAVRDTQALQVQMLARRTRRQGVQVYCDADFTITDSRDGKFEVGLKTFMT